MLRKQKERSLVLDQKLKQQLELTKAKERASKIQAEQKIKQQEAHLAEVARQRSREK